MLKSPPCLNKVDFFTLLFYDSVSDCNLVSLRSEFYPLTLDSLGDSLCTSDFSSQPTVRGRLKLCISFWRSLGASQFILNFISQGYKIAFFELPTNNANNASALSNSLFMSQAVNELLHANLVEEIFCVPDIVYLLSVSTRSCSKQRLILDLMHVNSFIFKQRFKCKDLSIAIQIFDQDFHLFKFDLKSRYHHIEIFPAHRKFLTFAWDFGTGSLSYFQFCVRVCSQWRQIITWLGVILNTIEGSIKATDERIAKLCYDLEILSTHQHPTCLHVKCVASIAGQIISISSWVGPVARIMKRFLFSVISSAVSWDCEVLLAQDATSEIDFWRHNVHALNGKVYWGLSLFLPRLPFLTLLIRLVVPLFNFNRELN